MIKEEDKIELTRDILNNWQEIVDVLAWILNIPAALVMKIEEPHIKVLISSHSKDNPYNPGDKEELYGSGLYCETVIKTQKKLLVKNALVDENWKNNPDIKLHMISYLGFPILLPNGKPFGTLCILDKKENAYSEHIEKLLKHLRDLIQSHLEIACVNQVFKDKNKQLTDYLSELQSLRGLIHICSKCKSIKDNQNNWHPIEHYLIKHPEANFSHSICPQCMKNIYPEFDETPKKEIS